MPFPVTLWEDLAGLLSHGSAPRLWVYQPLPSNQILSSQREYISVIASRNFVLNLTMYQLPR